MATASREHLPPPSIEEREWRILQNYLRGDLLLIQDAVDVSLQAPASDMIARRPLAIARCAVPADAVTALEFARRHDLPVTISGEGHHEAAGSLVLDCSTMKVVSVTLERHATTAGEELQPGDRLECDRRSGLLATWLTLLSARRIGG
ncbi:MAG TPA: hypothetical protein VD767_07295 [Thermomicrobiales bacterium]|nr:hypothetical protein [Thermomicrobiales bacterium]